MDFITDDFIDYIIRVEGSRKKRGKHYAYKSAEGGAKTIGYGHKIKKGENFSSGLTENQARMLLDTDLAKAAQGVQKSIGKDWDTLDPKRKQMLVGMQFNLGSVKGKFPKFTEAVINNDRQGMVDEYKRYFKAPLKTGLKSSKTVLRPDKQKTKKELKDRNEQFFDKYLSVHPDAQGEAMPEDNEIMTLASNEDRDWQTIPELQEGAKNREKDINDEIQRQMGGDKKDDAFSSKGKEDYFANSEKSEKAVEADYRTMVAKGMKLIHGKESRQNMLQALNSRNPVDAVANITYNVIARIDAALMKANKTISDEVKAVAANNLMGQILEVGEASGVVNLDDNEKELAFSLAIQKYTDAEIKAGRMNKEMFAEETGRSVANMDESQRRQLHEQLQRIDQTAQATNEKYGMQSMMPGMLGKGGPQGGLV
jgi:GH24 family phage-related lysozyme (muramidase)